MHELQTYSVSHSELDKVSCFLEIQICKLKLVSRLSKKAGTDIWDMIIFLFRTSSILSLLYYIREPYILDTLIFLIGEVLEKVLRRSDNIFGLSLMPEIQWSKKFSILMSVLKGRCKQLAAITAHLPNGPYTWFLPLLLPLDWLFPALDTVLSESEKNGHFSTLDPKYVRLLRHIPQKATKVKIQFV